MFMFVRFSIYCLRDNSGVSWVSVNRYMSTVGGLYCRFALVLLHDRDTHTHLIAVRGG